jgi:predicted amidohydrolase YtcJ
MSLAHRACILVVLVGLAACWPSGSASPSSTATTPSSVSPSAEGTEGGNVVLVGRIVTMDEPAEAEAVLIEDGVVTAIGTEDEVLALADDQTQVINIGENVAYPGFIDAHAHWIGDRDYYGIETPAEAMDLAAARGWTSISEQWNDQGKLAQLEALAAENALPLRVDAYLALNALEIGGYYGDWYVDHQRGPVGNRLRIQGLKIHLDSGTGAILYWEPADLVGTIGRAVDASWQVTVHTVSHEAHELVLGAFEEAIGPNGPNPLHHRIEHALQVTDDQLARMVAMDLVPVLQLDGAPYDWVMWAASAEGERARDLAAEDLSWLARWRDFVDAGLHVAASSDAPWFFPSSGIADDLGRPQDQIAGGMDGRGREFPETPDWMLDDLLTADEGLKMVTLDGAWAVGDEAHRGHLAVGTYGDVTILSGDVTAGTADEIRALDVIATIVGGTSAYCADPTSCP